VVEMQMAEEDAGERLLSSREPFGGRHVDLQIRRPHGRGDQAPDAIVA